MRFMLPLGLLLLVACEPATTSPPGGKDSASSTRDSATATDAAWCSSESMCPNT